MMASLVDLIKAARGFGSVAPHVEKQWAEDFVFELRLADVSGADIGAALSEVESHCVESGQDARSAFGDPAEYARNLNLPPGPATSTFALIGAIGRIVVPFFSIYILIHAVFARIDHKQVEVTVGMLVTALIVIAAMAAIIVFSRPIFRFAAAQPFGLAALAGAFIFVVTTVPTILFPQIVVRLNPTMVIVTAAVAFATVTLWEFIPHQRTSLEDPVTSPYSAS